MAKLQPGSLVLKLRDGSEYPLRGADEAIAERIREAMSSQEERRAVGLRIGRLDRREDHLEEWKKRLTELARPTGDYRDGGPGKTGLLEVVEDPGATPEQRVAAAYALSRIEETPRHRIQVAAQASADDDLRKALEEAAEGELETARVERAMERFGEQDPTAR